MTQKAKQQRFGKCLLERVIGSGARSTVYLAWHEGLQIPVAVKVMKRVTGPQEAQSAERFVREARIAAQLSHPNIVRVYDCGERGDSCYLVLEYIEGENCRDKLDQWGTFDWQRAVQIVRQVAEALAYASRKGIIHRDLKPENIMIDQEGNARLADLGLAKEVVTHGSSATQDGDVLGTPYYMSPEQIRQPSDVDFHADLYSLGATLHHMVVGEPPFEAATPFEIMAKHLNEPLPNPQTRRPDLPGPLCEIIVRCMAKDPKQRYPSYAEMIRALDALTEEAPEGAPPPAPARSDTPAGSARTPAPAAVSAAGAPSAPAPAVRPVELPATRAQVRSRVVGMAALVGYALLAVLLYQYLSSHLGVLAGTGGVVAVLLLAAGCAWGALRAGAEDEEPGATVAVSRLEGVLTELCKRVGLPVPRLRVCNRRDDAAYAYSLFWSDSTVHIPGPWLARAEPTEPEAEAFVAQCLAGVYTGDSFLRTLLAAPVGALRLCRNLGVRLSDALGSDGRAAYGLAAQGVTVAWMMGACLAVALLFVNDFWAGVMGLGVGAELLLAAAFERYSRYGADAFAARVVGAEAVQSLLVLRGTRGPDARRMVEQCMGPEVAQAWSGHPLVPQERTPVVESAIAYFSEMEYNPDTLELARTFFSVTPAPPERLNRLLGLSGGHSLLAALVNVAIGAYASVLGRSSKDPLTMRDMFPARLPLVAGAAGGALVVALTGLLYMRDSADYVALVGVVSLVALALGFVVAPGACGENACAARLSWTLANSAVALTLVTMLGLCLLGTPALSHFAVQFPAGLVLTVVLSAAAAALLVRLGPKLGIGEAAAPRRKKKARPKPAEEETPDPAEDMPTPRLAKAEAPSGATVH